MEFLIRIIAYVFAIPFVWFFDFLRLKDEIRFEGGQLIRMQRKLWDSNGNWDSKTRIYNVTYVDGLGRIKNRICKMDMGVGNTYWLE